MRYILALLPLLAACGAPTGGMDAGADGALPCSSYVGDAQLGPGQPCTSSAQCATWRGLSVCTAYDARGSHVASGGELGVCAGSPIYCNLTATNRGSVCDGAPELCASSCPAGTVCSAAGDQPGQCVPIACSR